MKLKRITIEAGVPDGVTHVEVEAYIKDALESWGKQFRPPGTYDTYDEGDPFWDCMNIKSIKVQVLS